MPKRLDLVGQKFGRLLVVEKVGKSKDGRIKWLCKCDCGTEIIVIGTSLKGGNTKSCGCLHREQLIEYNKNRVFSEEDKRRMSERRKGLRVGKDHPYYGKKGKDRPNYKHGLSKTRIYHNQAASKRRAKKKNQTPLNVDIKKIQFIYSFCEMLNQVLEEKYEVDHIKPISKGGLHHQDNLQILKASLNRKKWAKITNEYKGITLKDIEKGGWIDLN